MNSLLSEDEATIGTIAGAKLGACNTMRINVGVSLVLVKIAPTSSFLRMKGGFQQRLEQIQGPAIALAE